MSKLLKLLPYFLVKDKIHTEDYSDQIGKAVSTPPPVYNQFGEEYKVFYLSDTININTPYSLSREVNPRRILWDRYNVSLDTHFYVDNCMFEKTYPCNKKYGILRESEQIIPGIYNKALESPELMKDFDKIFTSSDRMLDKYSNAVFAPAGNLWYGTKENGGVLSDNAYLNKDKNISIVASNKTMCELHVLRAELARYYKDSKLVDAYGNAVGRFIEKKSDSLERYRYSIVLENDDSSYYFTEKILDCFASMTVPIYVGAKKIGEFFDEDGIIQVSKEQLSDFANMDKIISSCNEEDYNARLSAIKENYNRCKEYICYEDYLCDHYSILE